MSFQLIRNYCYALFCIETYEPFEFILGLFPHGMTRPTYENILKCGKCVPERNEIHKSFRLWRIVVQFLRQTKAKD